jgi:hypothetical protein
MITIVCKACGDVTQKKARIHTFKTRFGGCKHCNKESMRQRISEKNRARQSYNYENKDTKQPIGSIYKITNQKNRNIYIGYTFSTLQERFKQHWDHSKRKKRNGTPVSSTYLHKAMRKYGKETFQIESMQTYSNISPIQIAEKEKEAIALHKPQYNLTKGGDIFGVALSKRQRAYAKERLIETVGKAVAMIDVKGRVIKKFKTLSEAARTLNCNSSGISKACRNAKPYRGYFWSYLNEEV